MDLCQFCVVVIYEKSINPWFLCGLYVTLRAWVYIMLQIIKINSTMKCNFVTESPVLSLVVSLTNKLVEFTLRNPVYPVV